MASVFVTHVLFYLAMAAQSAMDFLPSTLLSMPLVCATCVGLLMTWLDWAVYLPVFVGYLFWLFYQGESLMRSFTPNKLLQPVAEDF